jgi:hypothetical protein
MDLWNTETPVCDIVGLDLEIPAWIEDDIDPSTVAAIVQGGCDSGAYMPAVTYAAALDVMREHGDDVLQYIEDATGELPQPPKDTSWSGLACFYLSHAVELWASSAHDTLEAFEPEEAQP